MGKQKKQRHMPHKKNPTGLPSVKDFEANEEDVTEGDKEKVLQNIFGEVQSCNLEEKLSALQTLESMSCDFFMAVQIAKDGIVRIVGPLLMDRSPAIRTAAASTLRNIVCNGGEEAYVNFTKDDIMTPLAALLKQYYSEWQPKIDSKEGDVRNEKESFIQAAVLLWQLCENNEIMTMQANREDLVSMLLKFLDIDTYGIEIVTVVIKCMVCLSESNCTAIEKIEQSQDILHNLLNNSTADNEKTVFQVLSLKTAVIALLLNINSLKDNNQLYILCQMSFVNTLSEVLAVDHKELLSNFTSILPHEGNVSSSDKKKKIQENIIMLNTQQLALEIVTNLCFEEDDSVVDSDIDDSEILEIESKCMDDDAMNNDLKMMTTLPVELMEAINHCNLIDKIWSKTDTMDKDSWEILEQVSEGKAILKQFHILRCKSYLCLNNIFSSLEIDALGGVDHLYWKCWEIGKILLQDASPYKNPSNFVELLEAATSAMRAITDRLAEMGTNVLKNLTVADIQPILNNKFQFSNVNLRVNLIRILGNMALTNNENPEKYEAIKHISTYLLDICMTEDQVWIMAESIDALMDIYAEDNTNRLAADIQLVPKLQSLVSNFKKKIRQQKKSLGDKIFVVSTVNMNLKRFIEYKEKQIRKLK